MPYQVFWDVPSKVLCLKLSGNVAMSDFVDIDHHIMRQLKDSDNPVLFIVDASYANLTAHGIERIRTSQSYLQSNQIKRMLVLTGNKVTRLAVMLLFNLARPSLQFFDDPAQMKNARDLVIRVM